MHHDAVHLVPQLLVRDRVLPHQDRPQPPADIGGDHLRQRPGDAVRSLVGLDPQEVLFQPVVPVADLLAALEIGAGAVFGVDVDRPHQPLLPEGPVRGHRAAQADQSNGGYLQRTLPGLG